MEACLAGEAAWLGACAAMSCFGEISLSTGTAETLREALPAFVRSHVQDISAVDRR